MAEQNSNGTVRIFSARACAAPLEGAARLFKEKTGIHIAIDVCSRRSLERFTGDTGGRFRPTKGGRSPFENHETQARRGGQVVKEAGYYNISQVARLQDKRIATVLEDFSTRSARSK